MAVQSGSGLAGFTAKTELVSQQRAGLAMTSDDAGIASSMAEPSGDCLSRPQEYKQQLGALVEDARGEVERQAPDVLDRMAATARNIAQRLDEMAGEARQRA
jgi:hypothetical protein